VKSRAKLEEARKCQRQNRDLDRVFVVPTGAACNICEMIQRVATSISSSPEMPSPFRYEGLSSDSVGAKTPSRRDGLFRKASLKHLRANNVVRGAVGIVREVRRER